MVTQKERKPDNSFEQAIMRLIIFFSINFTVLRQDSLNIYFSFKNDKNNFLLCFSNIIQAFTVTNPIRIGKYMFFISDFTVTSNLTKNPSNPAHKIVWKNICKNLRQTTYMYFSKLIFLSNAKGNSTDYTILFSLAILTR